MLALLGVAGGVALAWGLLQGLGAVRVSLLVPVALDLSLNGRVRFPAREIASVTVALGLSGYDQDEAERFFDRARERVRRLPGVQAISRASRAPLSINFNRSGIEPADEQAPDPLSLAVETVAVGEGYFEALGVPILEGRPFDDAIDTTGAPRVAVVNEALARRFWPGGSAIGRRIRPAGADGGRPTVEIVGVARNYKVRFLQEPPTPYVHFAASQSRGNLLPAPVLLARTESGAGALGAAMQRELRTIDPDVVFLEGLTLRDNTAAQLLPARLLAAMLGAAGLVAVWLAAIGLYGVIACAIVRRTQEIGIRMALGATSRDVFGLVVQQGTLVVGIGAVLGSVSAFAAARATAGVLFGIDAGDVIAWGGALVVLIAVGVVAHAIPALRAVRVTPSVALRAE